MIAAGGPEYAAARMHAWLGRRPDAVAWRGICEARGLTPMLDLLSGTALAALAAPLAHAPDLHALDRAACQAWRVVVRQAARWVMPELSAAVAWCAPLPLLPALAHLLRGEDARPWMAAYPELAPFCTVGATAPDGELALLARRAGTADALGTAWLAEWRRRLPRQGSDTGLGQLASAVAAHLRRFAVAQAHESVPLGEAFERGLLRRFRRAPQDPSAVFAWLGLVALDIRRLRGEFAWRIALPDARRAS